MHGIEKAVGETQWLVRRVRCSYALGLIAIAVMLAFSLLGAFDYWLRPRGVLLRLAALATACAGVAWVIWRLQHLLFPRDDLISISRQLELYFGQLRGRLANSIEFLSRLDSRLDSRLNNSGEASRSLQSAAIAATERELASLNLSDAVETKSTRWVWWPALTLLAMVVVGAWWEPDLAMTAAHRILLPFSDVRWPPRNQLSLNNVPSVVPIGQDVELTVANKGSLAPATVYLQIRNGSEGVTKPLPMRRLPDKTYTASLLDLRETVEVRATGGDDVDMSWHQIRVVELPRVTTSAAVVLYPEYSGIEPARFATQAEVLVGSRVRLLASTTTRAGAARLVDRRPGAEAINLSVVTRAGVNLILGELANVSADFDLDHWQLAVDRQGATQRLESPWRMRVRLDEFPRVRATPALPFPAITPDGVLPVNVTADDDIELRTVRLFANNNAGTGARANALVRTRPRLKQIDGLGDTWNGRIELDLRQLSNLSAGQQLTVTAEATDFLPQEGESEAIVIDVISRQTMSARLIMMQSAISRDLESYAVAQRDLAARTKLLAERATRDRAELREVRNQQAEIVQRIATSDGSAVSRLAGLLDALHANRLNEQRFVAAVSLAAQSLSALAGSELRAAEQALDQALRAGSSSGNEAGVKSQLTRAATAQQLAYRRLQDLLRQLRNTDAETRAGVGLRALREQQEDLNTDTRRTWIDQVANQSPAAGASPEELSFRQRQIGRRLDEIQQELEEFQSSESELSGKAEQALNALKQNAVSGLMRQSERALGQNRLSDAQEMQRKILQAIKAAEQLSRVANQPPADGGSAAGADQTPGGEGSSESHRQTPPTGAQAVQQAGDARPAGELDYEPRKSDRAMISETWGDLPPGLRERALNSLDGQFHPQYSEQLKAYFRRLAEEGAPVVQPNSPADAADVSRTPAVTE